MNKEKPLLATAAVVDEIIKVVQFVHSFQTMTVDQVAMTASLILKKYYFLRLDEITIAFENGMTGEYGEVKKLDGTTLLMWLDEYDSKTRSKAVIDGNKDLQINNIYEANQIWNLKNETTGKTLGQVYNESLNDTRRTDRIKHIQQDNPREKTNGELWADLVQAEFDELHRKNPNEGTPRMVEYGGKWVDQTEFYNIRFEETQPAG